MVVIECCGGISNKDPRISESANEPPYITRNCFSKPKDQWSYTECNKHCCEEGSCIPTEDGGYCRYRDEYWVYDPYDQSRNRISRNKALSKGKYETNQIRDPYNMKDKYYQHRLYDNTRKRVIQDLTNEIMNRNIMKPEEIEININHPDTFLNNITDSQYIIALLLNIIFICILCIMTYKFVFHHSIIPEI